MPLLVIMILIIAVGAGRSPEGAGARGLLRRLLEGACGRVVMRLLYIYIYIERYIERERDIEREGDRWDLVRKRSRGKWKSPSPCR